MKLDGKPLNLKRFALNKTTFAKFLDQCSADEVFSQVELAKKLNLSTSCVNKYSEDLPDHSQKVGKTRVWGSKKAIAELRRQLQTL
jgi:hypothetical protein